MRCLSRLADALIARPARFVWPQLILFVVLTVLAVTRLQFDMDRNALVGEDKASHRNFLAMKREFTSQDDLVAVIESEDHEKNRQFAERLGARLEAESTQRTATNLFTDVFFKGDLRLMGPKALLFFPQTTLVEFKAALGTYRPFMEQFTGATNLASLFRQVNALIRATGRQRDAAKEGEFLQALPALQRLLHLARQSLDRPGQSPSPGVEVLFGGGAEAEREKYVTFSQGRIYLVSAKPRVVRVTAADMPRSWADQLLGRAPDTSPAALELLRFAQQDEVNAAAIQRFRELMIEVSREVPGVNIGTTGESVLDYDEMVQTTRDSTVATIWSLVLVAVIFVVGYHEFSRPLKAISCLIIGIGYTMGYTTLVVGHLNILTVTFVPMLIGLAIDFGVHLVTRFEEETGRGLSPEAAVRLAVVYTGQGIFTGCFTTAGAFFAMALTEFKGIREMGLIMGGALVLCLIPMITILPIWLLRRGRGAAAAAATSAVAVPVASGSAPAGEDARARLERLWLDRPWMVLGIAGALCVASLATLPGMRFDYNLLHMQSEGLPSVIFEHKLIAGAEKSVLYAAISCDTLEEAARLEPLVRALPSVSSTDSMARFLNEDQVSKLALIHEIKRELAPLKFLPVDPGTVDMARLGLHLLAFKGYLGLAAAEVRKALTNAPVGVVAVGVTNDAPDPQLLTNLMTLGAEVGNLLQAVSSGSREVHAERLAGFQRAFLGDLRETIGALQTQDDSGPLRVADLPPALRNRFVGRTGKHLLQVYPKEDVWEREPQERFVRELRSVAPNVTGTPVQLYEYETLLKDSYVEAAWYALGAITLLVLAHFRSISSVLLSLFPVVVGALWMVGCMRFAGGAFNLANIMTLPLVIGIGVTNGIHILNRYAEEKNPSLLAKSTGKAVLVSGLTTIVGFGCLVIADHRGIRSLGGVMATGTATCMIAGLTALPAILTLRERYRSRRATNH